MRKIALVTSTRAEYGIMSRLIEALSNDSEVDFYLLVTGAHLSKKFGETKNEISQPIYEEIDIQIEKDPAHSLSLAVLKFSEILKKIKPDLLVLLGDRYEIMGVGTACMLNNIPIAHIGGGDSTGGIDEAIRHAITKMSHLHFTTCESSKKRVIQLGENPNRVFNVGSLAVENMKHIKLLSKDELEKSLNFKLNKKNLLVTFHPVTLEGNERAQFSELLAAFDELKNTNIIITCPNSDSGNDEIFALINSYKKTHKNVSVHSSLGMRRYFSCMRFVDIIVGNSSSGIYEAPSFKKPTINIGSRQNGRVQADSIINCKPFKNDILNAINAAYKKDCSTTTNPYEKQGTMQNIKNIIKNYDLNHIIKKEFYLL